MSNKKTTKKSVASATKKTKASRKESFKNIQQTNGKVYDIEKVKEIEALLDVPKTNPFGTADIRIFEENLASMTLTEMQAVAVRAGVFPNGNKTVLKSKLVKAFKSEGFGVVNTVFDAPQQIKLNPKNKDHKEILDYLKD